MQNRLLLILMSLLMTVADMLAQPQVTITPLDGPDGLNHNKVTDMLVDHRGLLWVSSWAGIFRFDGYRFTEYLPLPGDGNELSNPRLDNVGEDEEGNLWCKSYDKLYRFDVNTHLFKDVTKQGGKKLRQKMMNGEFRRDGYRLRVWEHTLSYFDEQKKEWIQLVDKLCFCVIDDNGIVWAIRDDGGVERIEVDRPLFSIDDQGEHILSQLKDRHGNIWQGLNDGSIRMKNSNGEHRGYLDRQGHVTSLRTELGRVYCMSEKKDGTLLFGTRGEGLFELVPQGYAYTLTQYKHQETNRYSISDDNIYSVLPAEDYVLVGTYKGGLNVMKGSGAGTYFLHGGNDCRNFPPGDRMHCVRSLASINDVFVMGTSSGIYTFKMEKDLKKVKFYYSCRQADRAASLPSNEVTAVNYLPGIGVFVSTAYSGICLLKSENLQQDHLDFKTWNTDNGAPSNRAIGVFPDAKGRAWVVYNDGLSMVNSQLTSSSDFLTNTNCYKELTNAQPIVLNNGNTLLGSVNGSVVLCLDSLRHDLSVAPIVMTAVRVMGKPVSYAIDSDTLTLESNQRNFTLEFAALFLGTNDKVEYAYRVEGRDSTWIRLDNERTIHFFNLRAGTYKLYVKSTNNDRVWGKEKAFTIIVKPTFWETGWAWLIYALLGLLLILAVIFVILYIYRLRMNVGFEKRLTDMKLKYFTDISHDLRTPLTLIDGPVTEMLDDSSLSEKNRSYLTLVHHNAQRMLTLVNQILDFRKIQNHKMRLLIERVDLKEELTEVMADFRYLAEDHKMDFALQDNTREAALIWGDKDKIQKIFFNLISNAFKYTAKGSKVWLELNATEKTISVAVCDTGKGMSKTVAARLFERFETVITDNYMKSSTGIGLSLVKELVELHHAQLKVETEEGRGSRFYVIFQKGNEHFKNDQNTEVLTGNERQLSAETSYPMDADAGSKQSQGNGAEDETDVPLIMIVEDDAEMLGFVSDILSKEYRILKAVDGQDGLEKATSASPDLIISDINMPRLNGWQMLEQLKMKAETSHIPVVLLTANSTLEDQIKGAAQGVDDYLIKPFSTEYLRARVQSILQKQHEMQQRYMERFVNVAETEKLSASDIMKVELPADNGGVERRMAQIDAEMMRKLRDYMEDNLSENIPIQELADQVGMSRTLFYNKIRSITGQTPIDFYRKYHVERAAQMMREDGLTIAEACYATGFSDPKYFSKVFKKFMDVSPSDYRNVK